ncbi:MAG: NTP transferase domain-containing protein [Desulfobacterales bacterium]|jgi:bifunctional UDP-N-acetylglucosamine pyrophosphorylase/glucosamine-1-phosphate N-acetyltransferase/UDP-N-acetylglucosamine pyrophosphorylase
MKGNKPNCGIIILAAGLGKRMKSDKAKVLHEIEGRAMVSHVADTACTIAGEKVVIVVGHQASEVQRTVRKTVSCPVRFALQERQLGTGHAVSCAVPFLDPAVEEVVILYGDVPLLRKQTIQRLLDDHTRADRDLTVLVVEMEDPSGYGRILTEQGNRLIGIVEEADASETQKRIGLINTGIYCVKRRFLAEALPLLSAENAQSEYYLTDIVGIGHRQGRRMGILWTPDPDETLGVNSVDELERVKRIFQCHRRVAPPEPDGTTDKFP